MACSVSQPLIPLRIFKDILEYTTIQQFEKQKRFLVIIN